MGRSDTRDEGCGSRELDCDVWAVECSRLWYDPPGGLAWTMEDVGRMCACMGMASG